MRFFFLFFFSTLYFIMTSKFVSLEMNCMALNKLAIIFWYYNQRHQITMGEKRKRFPKFIINTAWRLHRNTMFIVSNAAIDHFFCINVWLYSYQFLFSPLLLYKPDNEMAICASFFFQLRHFQSFPSILHILISIDFVLLWMHMEALTTTTYVSVIFKRFLFLKQFGSNT